MMALSCDGTDPVNETKRNKQMSSSSDRLAVWKDSFIINYMNIHGNDAIMYRIGDVHPCLHLKESLQ